ncbi:glycosyltransferase family 92 protein [Rhodobacterales bacterium HKCCE2091]|nr:glycosyltransferase family 92 protein [Rhodobacterales bacterium HKCCE2091]
MRITAITPMKNEGPFILEWLAYHILAGLNDFLIFTNDCTDGTDLMLERLDDMGLVRHMPNPSMYRGATTHHHAVIHYIDTFLRPRRSDWYISMDADEFIAVHAGRGRLRDLFDALPDAQLISLCHLPFGCNGVRDFEDAPVISQFTRRFGWEAPDPSRSSLGIKTLVRRDAPVERISNHAPQLRKDAALSANWVNGGGEPLPEKLRRTIPKSLAAGEWSSSIAQVNHYAVRAMDTFLVQAERGNANHDDLAADLKYWRKYDVNDVEDLSAARHATDVGALMSEFLRDEELRRLHEGAVAHYRDRIAALRDTEDGASLRRRIERFHVRHWETGGATAEGTNG